MLVPAKSPRMTIKGLWDLIDENFPTAIQLVTRDSLRGYRVAIDAYHLFYTCRALVRKRAIWSRDIIVEPLTEQELDQPWLSMIMDRLLEWINRGITPILVLDGPPPLLKAGTRAKRTQDKEVARERITELSRGNLMRNTKEVLDEVRKLTARLVGLPTDSVELAKEFFSGLGLPVVTSTTDGERLCAALCRTGYAAVAVSADGDTLAHGSPFVVRGPGNDIYRRREGDGLLTAVPTYKLVDYELLLRLMGLTGASFLDFCIMCGCDYNENMKGIGPKRSLDLIRRYGTIDEILAQNPKLNGDSLNYHNCRQLYSHTTHYNLIERGSLELLEWHEGMSDHCYTYGLGNRVGNIEWALRGLPRPRDFRHRQPEVLHCGGLTLRIVDTHKEEHDELELLPQTIVAGSTTGEVEEAF